ncbi:MAG: DUF4349 domain-containing protein [Ruminococcaceae bacterium]|nr:DUF4349 domain-containing protein [Oscillospiraceae bacterium]
MKKKMLALLLLLAFALTTLAGCSQSANRADYDMNGDAFYSEEKMEMVTDGYLGVAGVSDSVAETTGTNKNLVTEQKLIKTVSIDTQTEDMDTLLNELSIQIDRLGGYVENREVYNGSAYSRNVSRWASLIVRVPVENLNQLVQEVQGVSNVIRHNENVDDVTLRYVDTASHKAALETEYDRLMVLLEKAETMADLLEIEARLTDVRYELENITSQLRVYDNKITYATVNLSIEEVQKLTPVAEPSVGQRISGGFMESLADVGEGLLDLLVFLLANSPQILLWAAILLGVFFLIRYMRRKKRARKQREQENRSRQIPGEETGKAENHD